MLARPPGEGPPGPAVVVIHDLTGFRADTARHCDRFAAAGFTALAPDLFGGGHPGCVVRALLSHQQGGGEGFAIIEAARAWLADQPGVDPSQICITGFCMGGGFALLAAADGAYAVAAPFYGTVPAQAERLRGLCPTIAQFGAKDLVFRSHHRRLSAHLAALDVPHEVVVYEGVGHSFMNDHRDPLFALGGLTPMRASYSAETEAVAWDRMLAFFRTHLAGG